MATLSEEAGAQDQLLGLRSYYYNEYQKAEREVGDARVTDARECTRFGRGCFEPFPTDTVHVITTV